MLTGILLALRNLLTGASKELQKNENFNKRMDTLADSPIVDSFKKVMRVIVLIIGIITLIVFLANL